ncbi:MAG TPA: LacI family DNA-binding transcriptional regulator, partial [Anaerolineae bacterium]|nr:LacI family DNA-binding transcriptional regulator [Anaerolineae bacterium]
MSDRCSHSIGPSVTTVSRAQAGYPAVAAKTRERVIRTTREMGYVPNLAICKFTVRPSFNACDLKGGGGTEQIKQCRSMGK